MKCDAVVEMFHVQEDMQTQLEKVQKQLNIIAPSIERQLNVPSTTAPMT